MTHASSRSFPARFACPLLAALGIVLLWSGATIVPAFAADAPAPAGDGTWPWIEIQPDKSLQKARTVVQKLLQSGTVPADQRQLFDDYYRKWVFPRWTLRTEQSNLPKLRSELRNDLRLAKFGEAHNRLTDDIVVPLFQEWIANAKISPYTRINCAFTIGELFFDDTQTPQKAPVMLPGAVPVLLKLVDDPDPKQLDGVRAAALVGLVRHSSMGIANPQMAASVSDSMVKLAKTTSVQGRTPSGHSWIRARAIEVLGNLKSIGANSAVADLLGEIVGDSNASVMSRQAAADALGKLDYSSAVNINAGKIAAGLVRFAANSLPVAKQELEQKKDGAGRRLKSSVYSVARGLKGMSDGLKDATQKKAAADALAKVQKLIDAAEKITDDEKIVGAIAGQAAVLEQ